MLDHLFSVSGMLNPSNSKCNISYSFYLTQEYDAIQIHFVYKPKVLLNKTISKKIIQDSVKRYTAYDRKNELENWEKYLPVKNLLTIALSGPDGFRGCAHRQNHNQYINLSEDRASAGMLPGRIKPGLWTVTVSAHAVVTTRCEYRIQITGGEANDGLAAL